MIIGKIRREGPISFRDYMDMVLYEPGHGYYASPGEKIGKNGDFYTSPTLTPLFGEMIARQLQEMWIILDKAPFTIVECGAGTGALCRSVLHALETNTELYDQLRYFIVEKGRHQEDPEGTRSAPVCQSYAHLRDLPPFTGCILSNELIDNFPVHRVVMEEELMEIYVDHDGEFVERLRPAPESCKEYLRALQVDLPPEYRTEINLQVLDWIKDADAVLKKGFILTIDYGYPSSSLYNGARSNGTLVCYHRHQVNHDPFSHIGCQDITAHVNFSALDHWGSMQGLESCGFTSQGYFLQALGLAAYCREIEQRSGPVTGKEKEFVLQTLLLDMGTKFKVLIQQKGLRRPLLSGLRFRQPLV